MRRVILHFHQVCWMGGVTLFVKDFAAAFPEYKHESVYLLDWKPDYAVLASMEAMGIGVSHAPKVTLQLIKEIDPSLVILHNTPAKKIDPPPYDWLKHCPLLTYSHMLNKVIMPADANVFVSRYLYNRWHRRRWRQLKNVIFCPPCINTAPYAAIERFPHNPRCVIGRLATDSPKRYPSTLVDIMQRVQDEAPNVSFMAVGGSQYLKNPGIKLSMPPRSANTLRFYKDFDVCVVHNVESVTDTWSRIVTEAMASGLPVVADNRGGPTEQIENGVDGFLCNSTDEFVARLRLLAYAPKLRYEMGMKARAKAVAKFGLDRLRRDLGPLMERLTCRP